MLLLTLVVGMSMLLAACGGGGNSSSNSSGNSGSSSSSNSSSEGSNSGSSNSESSDSGSSSDQSASGKLPKVTLNVTTIFGPEGGSDPGAAVYNKLVDKFTKKYPNVTIKQNDFTAKPATTTAFQTKYSGGTIPDLLWYFALNKAGFIYNSGKMVDMKKIMKANPKWAGNFKETAINQIKTLAPSDSLKAMPMVAYYEGLAVNTKLFEKYNLELPTTWDKFMKAVKTFNKNGVVPLTASLGGTPHYVWENVLLATGGADCHAKGIDEGIPKCYVDALKTIKKMYQNNVFPKQTLTLKDDPAARQLYINGQAAMYIGGSWAINGFKGELSKNTKVIGFPETPMSNGKYKRGNQVIAGFSSGWFMSKDAYKNKKKAAVKFLKFVTSKQAIKQFASAYGDVAAVNVTPQVENPASQSGINFASNAKVLEPASDGFIPADQFTHIWKGIASVVVGDAQPKELLKEARKIGQ